ncbi:DNA-binding transcriptional regulator, LysR family [Saccharopolyspora kobensis]|uniref:DNA-binding transcriptional regulator, LysR family n=1 Tax=Saccharopolyspora kobensis TaxID=146035 RepID=A0A1H5ZM43_9PSEU|nr:LysR family transcriptional regulator [Saccharopolyspora kobensis]SEG37200.1 DNA-binding transcriptional regulator, LysR family [Saccharopolyspora kobensis]SFF21207.1 DNA-binding transcriptional regulator, LysR family [Saccharopolyspora kobensis]
MEIRQLEYFLAVVEHNGVNRAAQQLHIAQASLSQSIRQLERELKLTLFHRTGRNLVLNSAGELLVEPARRVLRDVVAVRDIMRGARELQVGSITIGTMPEMSSDAVAAWSSSFTRLHPGIRLDLVEHASAAQLCEEVSVGNCELGFTTFPAPVDDLAEVGLGVQRLLLVMPPGTTGFDPAAPHDLARLDDVPLVVSSSAHRENDFVTTLLGQEAVVPRIVARAPNRHAQLTLVLNGAGSAFLPLRMAAAAARMGAVVVETRPALRTPFGIVYRDGGLNPAAQSFVIGSGATLDRWNELIAGFQREGLSLLEATLRADDELHARKPD